VAIRAQNGANVAVTLHEDQDTGTTLLMNALGTTDRDFLDGLTSQLWRLGKRGKEPDDRGINFMLSLVKGVEPKDEVEAMLAAQMAAVHCATMTFAAKLAQADTVALLETFERTLNKLARTFAAQIEALKRYRSKGEQIVRVERVFVGDGGQAIVGNVSAGGGARKLKELSHEPDGFSVSQSSPMPRALETHEAALPKSRR